MSSTLADRILEEHAALAASLPARVLSRERRRGAIERLASSGLPTSRDENWKYANLRPLERARFAPVAAFDAGPVSASDLPPAIDGYARYTFLDGRFAPELSDSALGSLHGPMHEAARAPAPDGRFALLNDAFAVDAAALCIAAGASPACLELLFVARAEAPTGASYPRVELRLDAGARLALIERHMSIGGGGNFVNAVVDVDIGVGASVDHYRLQEAGAKATWLDTLTATVGRDARYNLRSIALGGLSARSTILVQLAGERAAACMSMVALADRAQVQDAYARIEHAAAAGKSEQTFRGISAGRGRVGFNGKVVVRKEAAGTDSRQSLRGLLAGPEAEIDVRPQLEIYTDDVRCSHGATAGKLDENMLFYMLSRGLEPDTAQRLLKWAFLEDVVARIEPPELRRQIERRLVASMVERDALQELL